MTSTAVLATTTADTIADLATQSPATDHLNGDPAPTRRQTAAVLRTFADHTHNEHMVALASTATGDLDPEALTDYLHTIAATVTDDQRSDDPRTTIAGRHAADRILTALTWGRGDIDLRDQPRPTPHQIAAVLTAMADPTLTATLASDEVYELGADRANLGARWQRTTGIGRFFHALADHIADTETYNELADQ